MVSTNAAGTSDAITSSKTNAAVRQRRRIIKAGDESVVPPPLLLSSSLPTKKRRRKEFNNLISPRHKAVIVGSSVLGIVLVSCTLMFIILLGRIDDNGSNLATESFKDGSNLRKNAILQEEITTDASSKSSTKSSSANDLEHVEIYEALFQRSSKTVPEYHRGRYELSSTYSTSVMKQGCNLTVVLMDPRLPILPAGDPTWFSLESIAAYASTACVLLQTSYCIIQDSEDDSRDNTDESAQEQVVEIIYEHSLPLFRRMIEQGQVRVVYLDHEKYKMKSCSNFYNPSLALMNPNYWIDEFLPKVDSDLILMIQGDSFLCHHLDPEKWRDVAFVGGVWPRVHVHPEIKMCGYMPAKWRSWTHKQRMWESQQQGSLERINMQNKPPVNRPTKLQNMTFPPICTGGRAPVGNGGLSLRSRKWMVEAITNCPHTLYSGMNTSDMINLACLVHNAENEDVYFSIVLAGLQAPLPMAFEAALFSAEMLFSAEVTSFYGELSMEDKERYVQQRWGEDGVSLYKHMQGNDYTVPIGMHKPWWYHSDEVLQKEEMLQHCKFLKYMYQPKDSSYFVNV